MKKGLVVAGLAGGSGKSIVSVGLTSALRGQGKRVVPFKKGPDYIDAGWLQLGAAGKCYNLDPYLVGEEVIKESFIQNSAGADVVILEGNRGLYDGVTATGGYSTADLAVMLDLPVLLVVNCTKTTRTVAAMVLGCMHLDKRVDIRGVVLNHVATKRQRKLVTEAVETYTGIPVVGAIPRMDRDVFPMRHLGMIPYQEYENSQDALSFLRQTVVENVDLEKIESIMKPLEADIPAPQTAHSNPPGEKVRIGVLQDAAFQFYYSENLEALEREGAELIPINALTDGALPELDGLYIGGGFPETSARALAENSTFRASVKESGEQGLPIYAECGGLIYLGESISLEGEVYPLTGIFPVKFGMSVKPQAHGYSTCVVEEDNPFYEKGTRFKGHEFRYSTVLDYEPSGSEHLSLKLERGTGFMDKQDGLVHKNVFGLYTHVHADGTPEWAPGFVSTCRKYRDNRNGRQVV